MIETKTVSPHSMFLKYLRDLAVSLKEEPDKWSINSSVNFDNIKDISEEVFYGWANLTNKKLTIRQITDSEYGSDYYFNRIYNELAFDGLVMKFAGFRLLDGKLETIFETISRSIFKELSAVDEYEQGKSFFCRTRKNIQTTRSFSSIFKLLQF